MGGGEWEGEFDSHSHTRERERERERERIERERERGREGGREGGGMNWWREVGREGERGREREEFRDFARSAVYVSSRLPQGIHYRLLPTRPGARVLQTGGAGVECVRADCSDADRGRGGADLAHLQTYLSDQSPCPSGR